MQVSSGGLVFERIELSAFNETTNFFNEKGWRRAEKRGGEEWGERK